MAEIVNLNKLRKAKSRAIEKAAADANSVKFGLSKPEKARLAATLDKETRALDGHRREKPDADTKK